MPTDHLWLRASPLGKQCGLVSLPDGSGGFLHICVLPKLWASSRRSMQVHHHQTGAVSHVTLHELEHLRVEAEGTALGFLSVGVAHLGETEEGQMVAATSKPKDVDIVPAPGTPGQTMASLIDLMVMAERARIRTTGDTAQAGFEQSLLRFLQQAAFVRGVVPLLFQARPLYRERVEALDTPRGRVSEFSLLLSQAIGVPTVECAYDDLTMDSPLLRVVLAALRVVATDRLPRRIESLDPTLRAQATALTRHLHTITVLPPDRANGLAETLTLTPMTRHWAPVLSEAKRVLQGSGVAPKGRPDSVEGFVALRVATEKFWEQIVGTALGPVFGDVRVSADNRPALGVRVSPPWSVNSSTSGNKSYPDFMFVQGGRVVVADAKYKAGQRLSAADAYQLFAYSHLASLDGAAVTDALIVSAATAATEGRITMGRNLGRDLSMTLLRLRYPEPVALRTQTGWSQYLSHIHSAVRDYAEHALERLP